MKDNKITLGDVTVCLQELLRLGLVEEKVFPDGTLRYRAVPDKIKYVEEHPEVFSDSVEN